MVDWPSVVLASSEAVAYYPRMDSVVDYYLDHTVVAAYSIFTFYFGTSYPQGIKCYAVYTLTSVNNTLLRLRFGYILHTCIEKR